MPSPGLPGPSLQGMDTMVDSSRSAAALALLLATGLLAALAVVAAPGAEADTAWADPDEASVRPGVQMLTEGGQCTANFVFTDGSNVLLGYSAHCAGTGGATSTNGCDAPTHPTGTQVEIEGADQPGTLAYSSWETMQQRGETDADACQFNDFALVALHPDDHDAVNPTIPFWGGPEGVASGSAPLEKAYTYGNSSLRLGIELLSPKEGYSLGDSAGGWNHAVYTVTPGIPGDSGSAVLDRDGAALGSLSTLAIAPLAGSNGVTDLGLALDYANRHGGMNAELAHGTEGFGGGLVLPDLTAQVTSGSVHLGVSLW
jgi:hypothetical protein